MSTLADRLGELSRVPVLLVACDYDGTLAPIVDDPELAAPDREAIVALKMLAGVAQTHVAVISGRALSDLAKRAAEIDIRLVGSHGSEFEEGLAARLPPEARALYDKLGRRLHEICQRSKQFILEQKPAAYAFHYRKADGQSAAEAIAEIKAGPASEPGVHVRYGKKVIELSVVETSKGDALQKIRHRVGASAVLFLGDDLTDEEAFATLAGPDVGVKVGPGDTIAPFRVGDTRDVARMLAELAELRAAWMAGSHAVPIQHHSLLSDQRTVALVGPSGRVSWLCLPRIDSAAIFAELIGGPTAGFFEISAAGQTSPRRQAYDGDSLVLQTVWDGISVTDYFDCAGGRPFQRAGRSDLLRVIEGRGRAHIVFAPRVDFGRIDTHLKVSAQGIEVEGAPDPIVLHAPVLRWRIEQEGQHQSAIADVDLADSACVLELRYGTASLAEMSLAEPIRRHQTKQFWAGWAGTLKVPNLASDLVRRSALVLKALSYGPTGAIAAAATTSLPESIGGVRNWDYRYCWPRDAAMAAAALVRLGNTGVAMKYLDWILGVVEHCESPERLSPVYTVSGGHLSPEAEIGALAGYSGSRPVRIGNAASQQIQMDVFGPIVDLIALLADRGAPLSSEHWRLVELMVKAVGARWMEADHGIWEPRRPRRHNLHSKVMCWMTVDRALKVARYLGRFREEWQELRNRIAAEALERGWHSGVGAFTANYEDGDLDAAALWVGLSGLVSPDDARFSKTIDAVAKGLGTRVGLYRYKYDDGLPGTEGVFNLCTTWLIESLVLTNRKDEAASLFERYVELAGPTGLMAEEFDPRANRSLGNHPQAYSHLGLINAAVALSSS